MRRLEGKFQASMLGEQDRMPAEPEFRVSQARGFALDEKIAQASDILFAENLLFCSNDNSVAIGMSRKHRQSIT